MAPVVSGLSAIFLAPLLALLLGRAVLVEVVEFAAGEQAAAPLAVRFRLGSLNAPIRRNSAVQASCCKALADKRAGARSPRLLGRGFTKNTG